VAPYTPPGGVGVGSSGVEDALIVGLADALARPLPDGADEGLGEGVEQAASNTPAASAATPRINACCRCGRG
jgi:hypothetical protein